MKKFLVVVSFVLLSFPAFALQDGGAKLEIAYEGMGYSYREPHMDHPISLKAPTKHGGSIKYTKYGLSSGFSGDKDNMFGVLEARFLMGDTKYRGYTWGGDPASANGLKDWYVEGRMLAGNKYDLSDTWGVSPYLGIGYRFLSNHADEMEGGYRRESNYFYVPLGAELGWQMGEDWKLTFTGEFDWLIKGSQLSRMSDTELPSPYEYKDVRNQQSKGFGLRGSVKLETTYAGVGVFIEPFYRFWKIQNSKLEPLIITDGYYDYYGGDLVEPFNITREYGVKIGVSF